MHIQNVPNFLTNEAWLEGNFSIPVSKILRQELRKNLESVVDSKDALLPQNFTTSQIVRARLAAINAHDEILFKGKHNKRINP